MAPPAGVFAIAGAAVWLSAAEDRRIRAERRVQILVFMS
jgi:hypothetical protein